MEYFIAISIILIFSMSLALLFQKKTEQMTPVGIAAITLLIYITGLFNNLRLGLKIVEILAVLGLVVICYFICKEKETKKVQELVFKIITPGTIIYVLLSVFFIFVNKGRIFEDYDEFNHWGRIIKNMFMYNTFGVNEETIVYFNEYPPFTAIFQFLFIGIKNVFREDVIITAQCILYLSIIIPITQNIKWGKFLNKLLIIVPSIIFIPVIFYENFYLDILVDGIIGVMFASLIFTMYEETEQDYKYMKIFSLGFMLALTKTSGIALTFLAISFLIIKKFIEKNITKKELRNLLIVVITILILVSAWFIKTNQTAKRWDFKQYIETQNKTLEDQKKITTNFIRAIMSREVITYQKTTVIILFFVFICVSFYSLKKAKENNDKNYRYYSIVMLISIPIYMLFLLVTYITIFDISEAENLTCFDRYSSTILLANAVFQLFAIIKFDSETNFKKILIMFTIIIIFMPYNNISKKYMECKNYIASSIIRRDYYTKFKLYNNKIEKNSKILFIMGDKGDINYIKSLNEYETGRYINGMVRGQFENEQELAETAKKYNYIFIHGINSENIEKVKKLFKDNYINNNTLYKVNDNNEKIILEKVGK